MKIIMVPDGLYHRTIDMIFSLMWSNFEEYQVFGRDRIVGVLRVVVR